MENPENVKHDTNFHDLINKRKELGDTLDIISDKIEKAEKLSVVFKANIGKISDFSPQKKNLYVILDIIKD